jgi:hypothetical protein
MALRAPTSKPRPPVRLKNASATGLGVGVATSNGGINYEIIPVFGAARVRVRIKVSGNGGAIDLVGVGPDFDPEQRPAFGALTGTLYATGNPAQVPVIVATEATITMDLYGEGYVIVKYTGAVGAGAITYCDVEQV